MGEWEAVTVKQAQKSGESVEPAQGQKEETDPAGGLIDPRTIHSSPEGVFPEPIRSIPLDEDDLSVPPSDKKNTKAPPEKS
jgi:hypothetical protein